MNLFGSKKGNALARNYIVIPIFLFILGISSIAGLFIWLEWVDAFDTAGLYTGTVKQAGDSFTSAMRLMDGIVVLIMVALIIGVGITSWKIKVPAVYFLVMLVMGIFLGIVSYFFNFIFIQIVSQSTFDTVRVYFAKTILICTNLHWVMLVAIVIGSILTYSKKADFDDNTGGIQEV